MEKLSDDDNSLNERMTPSEAAASFNDSLKNNDINAVKDTKIVTFSDNSGNEAFTNI